ncbi:hypothetical protein AVEN_184351-1 [Araneus ventricosus]|uniref:Uncharacterized protein n=1 Tax=Araneus ventricosus TaxID=182803 RepID=A0A4Y2MFT2_ARAVE|nr:hypothetical protein AVEN_106259-1 [Araneus ventricosus]GBN25334.1 hypothetical protein AVEN_184351-1 [Araneus ventricosus]
MVGKTVLQGNVWEPRGMEPSTPDLGDKLEDFCDDMCVLKSTGIFSISLLGGRDSDLSRFFHMTSRPVRETIKGPCSDLKGRVSVLIDFERANGVRTSLESLFGVLYGF